MWEHRLRSWLWEAVAATAPEQLTAPAIKHIIEAGLTGLVKGMAIGVREPELAQRAVHDILAASSLTREQLEYFEEAIDQTVQRFREAAS
jgi:hypothetical protein